MTSHESRPLGEGHPLPPDHPEQTKVIVLWGASAVVILVILLVWLRSFFFVVRNETIQTNYLSAPNPQIQELHAREQALLTSYGWVDRQKGVVHVPIDRAMELMVRDANLSGEPSWKAPLGITPPGIGGSPGTTPAGTTPAGTAPTGTAPAGTAPAGSAPDSGSAPPSGTGSPGKQP